MTSKEALEILDAYCTDWETDGEPASLCAEELETIEKDLEEYETAKKLIHELHIILYGDDEDCKTDFDIIRKCQLKILNYLEDKTKRLGT